ncbi:hypothetical protein ACE7GA_21325 [Roseomonas sp. CCTCC AB2023176]|uniref:hypothetical protein n=1 Tax=Roseomonas sp. CCTCC AB2023176 TaxID=3342640 RepID=UPI0035E23F40
MTPGGLLAQPSLWGQRSQQPGRSILNTDPGGLLTTDIGAGGRGAHGTDLGPNPMNTGLDLGITPSGVAGFASSLGGRVGGQLSGVAGIPGLGTVGGLAMSGLAAQGYNNALSSMGLPGIGLPGVAMAGFGIPSMDLQTQALNQMASLNPTIGPAMPQDIALAQLNTLMSMNTDFSGLGVSSKGVDLSGFGIDGGGKDNSGMGSGGSVSGGGLADGGGKSPGDGGGKGNAGTGAGSESYQRGGYTGAGADGRVQPARRAGTVHEGEVVIPADMVRKYGRKGLLALVDGTAPRGLLG